MSRLDGDAVVLSDGRRLTADIVVIAAGAWTPALLGTSDLPTSLRTKHIQYSWFEAEATALPAFVDETTGLYGRPGDDGRILAGLPSVRWDIDPQAPPPDLGLAAETEAAARRRLPGLIGYRSKTVSAADCSSDPPGLKLRHVTGAVHTFTGGSGGAAKTALAASRIAAWALLDHALEPFG
jgi:glycine/D-amino acid oxidase-like deaminating enzyme